MDAGRGVISKEEHAASGQPPAMAMDAPSLPRLTLAELDVAPVSSGRLPFLFEAMILGIRVVEMLALIATSFAILNALDVPTLTETTNYVRATLLGVCFYALLSEMIGVYDVEVRFSVRKAWGRLLVAWGFTAIFLLVVSFLLKVSEDYSRGWAVGWLVGGAAAVCLVRACGVAYTLKLKRHGYFDQRVAIFGAGPQGDRMARYIVGDPRLTIKLVAFYDDRDSDRLATRESGLALRGNMATLMQDIRRGGIDQVIVALPWLAEARLQNIVAELSAAPVRIRLAPDLASFAFAQRPIVRLGDVPVLALFERPISGVDQLIKRCEDVILGAILLVLAAPLILVAGLAIKLDSKGPIFFRQVREGFNNRYFRIWKLRSMYADQCEGDAISQATQTDRRVTRVGRFLRRTSIDELPQLINVLTGEMSLVGPRPHAPSTRAGNKLFAEVVKTYAGRHNVKPGITGWAQVNGWRGETDTEEKLIRRLEHDLYYMERWSSLFDIYILIRTVFVLPLSKQAY